MDSSDLLKKWFLLLSAYKIKESGYIVAWRFRVGRTNQTCNTRAAVWRPSKNGSDEYRLIGYADLKLGNATIQEINFQYTFNFTRLVEEGDILGLYVTEYDNCNGSIVAYKNSRTKQIRILGRHFGKNISTVLRMATATNRNVNVDVALQAFVMRKM